jgi:ABC-2 type transport system ATP-binding protein
MIRTESLTKRFGAVAAIDGLTVAVPRGSVVGVLGPNGAGKTTLLRMLLGLVRPTDGGCRVLGRDVERQSAEVRRIAALVPESKALYGGVTAATFLRFYASFFADADRCCGARASGAMGRSR